MPGICGVGVVTGLPVEVAVVVVEGGLVGPLPSPGTVIVERVVLATGSVEVHT
jgi:hypothetical protein